MIKMWHAPKKKNQMILPFLFSPSTIFDLQENYNDENIC